MIYLNSINLLRHKQIQIKKFKRHQQNVNIKLPSQNQYGVCE
jgi:hypothetical protein